MTANCVSHNQYLHEHNSFVSTVSASGINLSVCKAGNVLSDWIVPEFHRRFGLVLTQYFVTFLCLLSFISLLYLIECEDVPTCNSLDNSNSSTNNSPLGLVLADSPVPGNSDKKEDNVSEDNNSTKSMSTIDIEKEISLIREKETSPLLGITNSSYDNTNNKPPSYRNTEISFSLTVWLLFCFTFLMSGILLPFTNISNSLILELYYPTAESESVQHQHEIFAARYMQNSLTFSN